MIVLTIRSDKPEAEIGLFDNDKPLAYETWLAHRQLAETIHTKIRDLLKSQKKDWPDVGGIICYKGPGSFTGLRIGASVANALAYSLNIPIVGASSKKWIEQGIKRLKNGKNDKQILPKYGSPVHITLPRSE